MESKEKLRKSFKENDRLKIKARPVNSSQNRCVILDTASPGDQGYMKKRIRLLGLKERNTDDLENQAGRSNW